MILSGWFCTWRVSQVCSPIPVLSGFWNKRSFVVVNHRESFAGPVFMMTLTSKNSHKVPSPFLERKSQDSYSRYAVIYQNQKSQQWKKKNNCWITLLFAIIFHIRYPICHSAMNRQSHKVNTIHPVTWPINFPIKLTDCLLRQAQKWKFSLSW